MLRKLCRTISDILALPENAILVRESLVAVALDLPCQGASLPPHPFLHPAWHRFGIVIYFDPHSEMAAGMERDPNIVSAFGERPGRGAALKVEVQRLNFARLRFHIAD